MSIEKKRKSLKKLVKCSLSILLRKLAPFLSDKLYLELLYRVRMGKRLNLKNPKTYTEKIQWLKLYNRNPDYCRMVDKYEAKKYVSDIIGKEYIIPTIGVYDTVEEIPWDSLPKQFVLKCTHDSGGIVICKNKDSLNVEDAKKKLSKGLKKSYFFQYREWPYKGVTPRIICEEYKVDESGYELKDYKWFCFDGDVKALFIATDRGKEGEEVKFDFFDTEFNHLPFTNGHPNSNQTLKRPVGFDKMKQVAAKLSSNLPHVRIDLYDINGQIYFGEMTFYHFSGIIPFEPDEWDGIFGSWIKLPDISGNHF